MDSSKKFNLAHADTVLSSSASDDEDNDGEYDLLSPQLGRALCCAPCFTTFDHEDLIIQGNAFDIIMVQSEDNKLYQNSQFLVNFNNKKSNHSTERVVLEVRERDDNKEDTYQENDKAWFPIIRKDMEGSDNHEDPHQAFWSCCSPQVMSGKISDLNGAAEEEEIASKLAPFLRSGKNPIRYLLLDNQKVIGVAHANIFLWTHQDRIVVMDIDGTITKSNARGVFDTIITETYKYCHEGVCQLLSRLKQQINTQILYVTSRPIGLATHTRRFLAHLEQESVRLPEGPLLGFGGSISELLIMELISKKTHHFKADMIWQQVVKPFRNVSKASSASPIFVAGVSLLCTGFGQILNPAFVSNLRSLNSLGILSWTYKPISKFFVHGIWVKIESSFVSYLSSLNSMAGVDLDKIYLINKKSQISVFDRITKEEWTNLTATPNGLFSATVGVPRPRHWYKTQSGTEFYGYKDDELFPHVLRHADGEEKEAEPVHSYDRAITSRF